MREVKGNLWDWHAKGYPVVITTNGDVNRYSHAVMGRGVAFEAHQRFPGISAYLAERLKLEGNHVLWFPQYSIFTFPVKHHWYELADMQLIERSLQELVKIADDGSYARGDTVISTDKICMVTPGVGNGKLDRRKVRPLLEKYLDDRFIVEENQP